MLRLGQSLAPDGAHVCCWHLADVAVVSVNIRFRGRSGTPGFFDGSWSALDPEQTSFQWCCRINFMQEPLVAIWTHDAIFNIASVFFLSR